MILLALLLATTGAAQAKVPCGTPYEAVTVAYHARAIYPKNARTRRRAIVNVRVEIAPDGTPESVSIAKSSGDSALDAAAIDAARRSLYTPKIVKCEPVAAQYLLHVSLNPAKTNEIAIPYGCVPYAQMHRTHESRAGRYLSRDQVLRALRLAPGEQLLGVKRETYGAYSRQYQQGSCDYSASPSQEVWVIRIRFSQPEQFMSALYRSGVEISVLDAATGKWMATVVTGKFLSGPFPSRPH